MIEPNTPEPTSAARIFGAMRTYGSAIGIAVTIAAAFEPLLFLSNLASYLLDHWSTLLHAFWAPLFGLLNLNLSIAFAEMLTVACLLFVMGVASRHTAQRADIPRIYRVGYVAANTAISALYTLSLFLRITFQGDGIFGFFAFSLLLGLLVFVLVIAHHRALFFKYLISLAAFVFLLVLDRAAWLIRAVIDIGTQG